MAFSAWNGEAAGTDTTTRYELRTGAARVRTKWPRARAAGGIEGNKRAGQRPDFGPARSAGLRLSGLKSRDTNRSAAIVLSGRAKAAKRQRNLEVAYDKISRNGTALPPDNAEPCHSNNERGSRERLTIEESVPMLISLWSGTGTLTVVLS